MKLDRYQLKAEDTFMVFDFVSDGPKGHIPKLIKFSETNLKNLFTLAFGDKDVKTGDINDLSISNNGDGEKVLATVAASVYVFTEQFPSSMVYATGSTKSRTRLYRMGITKYLDEFLKNFEIYGLRNDTWEDFEKETEYEAFLVKRKKQ